MLLLLSSGSHPWPPHPTSLTQSSNLMQQNMCGERWSLADSRIIIYSMSHHTISKSHSSFPHPLLKCSMVQPMSSQCMGTVSISPSCFLFTLFQLWFYIPPLKHLSPKSIVFVVEPCLNMKGVFPSCRVCFWMCCSDPCVLSSMFTFTFHICFFVYSFHMFLHGLYFLFFYSP